MAIDFSVQPDPFGSFTKGYNALQTMRDNRVSRDAGNLLASGDAPGAYNAFARAGMIDKAGSALEVGNKREAYTRTREVGNAFNDDPKKAAAAAAAGGDVQGAMQILTHVENMDTKKRASFKEANEELARMMTWVATAPPQERETRRGAVIQSLGSMFPNADAPEVRAILQRAQTMPLDDASLKAEASKVIAMDKLLGSYTMRDEGDNVVTYRNNAFAPPEEVSRRPLPPTRADARAERGLQIREENDRQRDTAVTPSKVIGPVLAKIGRGETLTPGEQQLYTDYRTAKARPDDMLGYGGDGGDDGDYGAAPNALSASPARAAPAPGAARAQPPGVGRPAARLGASPSSPAKPRSRAEAMALPRGTWFTDPSGNLIQKK
jgi:hypothetical protein